MILKALLSGLWVFPERRCLAVIFTLDPCFTFQFHCGTSFHLFPCDPTLSVFCFTVSGWKSCRKGCSLWSRRSWLWGTLVSALSCVASHSPLNWPLWFLWRFLFYLFSWWGPASSSLTAWKLNLDAAQPHVQRDSSAFLDAELLESTMVNFPRPLDLTACCHSPSLWLVIFQAILNAQSAGVSDIDAWVLMLPSSSRISPVTYHSVVRNVGNWEASLPVNFFGVSIRPSGTLMLESTG